MRGASRVNNIPENFEIEIFSFTINTEQKLNGTKMMETKYFNGGSIPPNQKSKKIKGVFYVE